METTTTKRVELIKSLVEYLHSKYKIKVFRPINSYGEGMMKSIIRHEAFERYDIKELHEVEIGWIKIEINDRQKRGV